MLMIENKFLNFEKIYLTQAHYNKYFSFCHFSGNFLVSKLKIFLKLSFFTQ